jgi:hypothetical protein
MRRVVDCTWCRGCAAACAIPFVMCVWRVVECILWRGCVATCWCWWVSSVAVQCVSVVGVCRRWGVWPVILWWSAKEDCGSECLVCGARCRVYAIVRRRCHLLVLWNGHDVVALCCCCCWSLSVLGCVTVGWSFSGQRKERAVVCAKTRVK